MGRNIARVSQADFVAVRCTLTFAAEFAKIGRILPSGQKLESSEWHHPVSHFRASLHLLGYGVINSHFSVAYERLAHHLCDQRHFVGDGIVPIWPIVSKGHFVAVRCRLRFWVERSGEPEHFPLTRPIKRNSIGAGKLAAGQIDRLRSIHDGCNDIWREPRDTNKLSQIPAAVI
jgi:hypothetical protein